jgi:hypothetical protein
VGENEITYVGQHKLTKASACLATIAKPHHRLNKVRKQGVFCNVADELTNAVL